LDRLFIAFKVTHQSLRLPALDENASVLVVFLDLQRVVSTQIDVLSVMLG